MKGYTIGDFIKSEGLNFVSETTDYYHRKHYWPKWFNDEFSSFWYQVMDMASPKKNLKVTNTFKIQGGYPHEVDKEHKELLLDKGVKRDYNCDGLDIVIPKININGLKDLIPDNNINIISFTTPKDSQFIRDITVVDKDTHKDLVFVYVIDRKSQIITAWSEKKIKGKYKIKVSKNILKTSRYKKC